MFELPWMVLASSALFWGGSVKAGVAVTMLPFFLTRRGIRTGIVREGSCAEPYGFLFLLLLPLIAAVNLLCNLKAYELTLAVYVISVKRLSSLFSLLWAFLFLKEEGLSRRLPAVLLMVAGIVWVGMVSG